jgi:hypothetical protein
LRAVVLLYISQYTDVILAHKIDRHTLQCKHNSFSSLQSAQFYMDNNNCNLTTATLHTINLDVTQLSSSWPARMNNYVYSFLPCAKSTIVASGMQRAHSISMPRFLSCLPKKCSAHENSTLHKQDSLLFLLSSTEYKRREKHFIWWVITRPQLCTCWFGQVKQISTNKSINWWQARRGS